MSLQHPTVVARAVFGLDDERATDAGLTGHKAANLARLTALGFPVPPGVRVSFLVYGVLYVVIYCASMWLLGMNDYERNLLLKPVAKLLRRA